MRNLRKDQGGYALLYVLVVIILLCAVAMMICTVSMQNLTAQQKSVERMVDKYAAQGEVEKILAQISSISVTKSATSSVADEETAKTEAVCQAKTAAENEFKGKVEELSDVIDWKDNSAVVKVIQERDQVKVIAELKVAFTLTATEPTKNGENKMECNATILTNSVEITSYTIENGGAA